MLRNFLLKPALRVFQIYENAISRRPLVTQICAGSVLVVAGDAAAQHLVEGKSLRDHDFSRSGNMVLLRGVIHSGLIIYWYRFLQTKVPMSNASLYRRLAVHLSLDQGLFGPANVAFFFCASGVLEGKSSSEIHHKLDDRLWQTISSAWILWIPFQFITFRFIPINFRLVTGQMVAVGWNCFM